MDNNEFNPPDGVKGMTDPEIHKLARDLRDEIAGTGAARQLLEQFVHQASTRREVSRELITYLRDAFSSYLDGGISLESALGVKHQARGQPKASRNKRLEIAHSMLEYLLEGCTQEDAIASVVDAYQKTVSDTIIKEAWHGYRIEALAEEQRIRRELRETWSEAQHKILSKLYDETMIWDIKPKNSLRN